MAGRIHDDDIKALRERADLAGVVGDYTSLRRAGTRLTALCPFHEEKTPSLSVDAQRGVWHCFGCQAGGDVYAFLMRAEALSFPEAVERLARIVGHELRYVELGPGARKALGRRTRLGHALAEAADFYARQLHAEHAAGARAYLRSRGLDAAGARRFGLGWAPDSWDSLVRHLLDAGFEPAEVVEAGLATQGRRGPVDRFRGRVMFPIRDATGRDVVAFGGRVLPGAALQTAPRDGVPPKYINSSESPVYKKSQTLYGLDQARADIVRGQTVLVVEGYMDVLGLHQAGVRNAVATCGTALTAEHFRLLERFAPRVVLALDADDAGFDAADRARVLAEQVGVRELGVLPLPPGKDPADLAAEGPAAVAASLRAVKTAVEFQIEHLLRGADTSTPEGQVDAYRRTFALLTRLPDRTVRYRYVRDLVAPAVRLSADRIERELDAALTAGGPAAGGDGPGRSAAPAAGTWRRAAPADPAGRARDPQLVLEREVLRTALQRPDLLPPQWQEVTAEDFRAPVSRTLLAVLRASPPGDLRALLEALPDEDARARVRALAMSNARVEPDVGHVAELVARLRAAAVQRAADELREEVARVGEQLGAGERRRLMTRLYELERRRRQLLESRDG